MFNNIQLKNYKQIPKPHSKQDIFKVSIKDLHPTQMCVGLSEVWNRQADFLQESKSQRLRYLRNKPIPIVRNKGKELWILDRHHRLRALLENDIESEAYGYLVSEVNNTGIDETLKYLGQQGWLYLFDRQGNGPHSPKSLPQNLLEMEDDPYRSLVWKLKKEGVINPSPLTPYHEFHWGRWLRTRSLPPFDSRNLYPAISVAKKLACTKNASHLAGWKGE